MFLGVLYVFYCITSHTSSALFLERINRNCHKKLKSQDVSQFDIEEPGSRAIFAEEAEKLKDSKFTLLLIFFSILIFLLIFLGILKGLLGLCIAKIGSYGMHLLIDLPRPLYCYQEKELRFRPVVYDVGGWPVHPDTCERTVRVLPKRTEFCLNIVFFLAYPLGACVFLCGLCCCIKPYEQSTEDVCFKKVNVVRLTNALNKKNNRDADGEYQDEVKDTKYVLEALRKSKESLIASSCASGCKCSMVSVDENK